MKKISLMLILAGLIWTIQTAHAQTLDTTKNHVEIKKKVKKGAHGRTVTKIKMEGKGTPDAISGAADGTVTGHLPAPPPPTTVIVPTPAPEPAPAPAPPAPTVVVVHDTVRTPAPAAVVAPAPAPPNTTEVTTTTETRPVATASVTIHHSIRGAAVARKPVHTYHHTYKKTPAATTGTKTTTTTTVKKTD